MIGKNNPLNIRYNPLNNWIGQRKHTKGFSNFDTIEHGVRAACKLIFISYRVMYGACDIMSIINRYAPSSENPTKEYISFLSSHLGISEFTPLIKDNYADMIYYMIWFEQGTFKFVELRNALASENKNLLDIIKTELKTLKLI